MATDPKDERSGDANEGEGSRSADLAYRERQQKLEKTHDAMDLGEQAAREVADDPEAFKRAEEEGKRRSKVDEHEK
jgi:hypothetical protein